MEGEETLLDVINEEDEFEIMEDDVDMVDCEEGEIVVEDNDLHSGEKQNRSGDGDQGIKGLLGKKNEQHQPNMNKNKKKKKKKRRKAPMNLDRFVRDTCRRLKEKKSYMIYTAVGCLGIPALNDLVNEVETIENCGGQVTADGSRKRTSGGVLWNIIKARQPTAYKEIMKKTREFEKQFRHPNARPKRESSSEGHTLASADEANEMCVLPVAEQIESKPQEERKSVYERIRVPVSYDDLFRVPLDSSQAQDSSA